MTTTSFIKALHREAPGLISDLSETTRGTPIAYKIEPRSGQVHLRITFGHEPHDLKFATETDAAKFLGRVYKSAKLWDSAVSLLLR